MGNPSHEDLMRTPCTASCFPTEGLGGVAADDCSGGGHLVRRWCLDTRSSRSLPLCASLCAWKCVGQLHKKESGKWYFNALRFRENSGIQESEFQEGQWHRHRPHLNIQEEHQQVHAKLESGEIQGRMIVMQSELPSASACMTTFISGCYGAALSNCFLQLHSGFGNPEHDRTCLSLLSSCHVSFAVNCFVRKKFNPRFNQLDELEIAA